MSKVVKSLVDGHWYYDQTEWSLVLDHICNAIDSFSESDKYSDVRSVLDYLADVVSSRLGKEPIFLQQFLPGDAAFFKIAEPSYVIVVSSKMHQK